MPFVSRTFGWWTAECGRAVEPGFRVARVGGGKWRAARGMPDRRKTLWLINNTLSKDIS